MRFLQSSINIYSLPFEKEIDFDEEIKKIKEDLDYQKVLKSVNSKLENKRFTDNAPDSIVQNEIKKKNDAISKSLFGGEAKKIRRIGSVLRCNNRYSTFNNLIEFYIYFCTYW